MAGAQSGPGFFETVNMYFDKAAALTDYPQGLLEQIKACNAVYAIQFPIRRNGGYEVVSAWRAKSDRDRSRPFRGRAAGRSLAQVPPRRGVLPGRSRSRAD